jgi:hypothetical protein
VNNKLPHIERSTVEAAFKIAGVKVHSIHEAVNQYWPSGCTHIPPWWLVITEYGVVIVGHRKRVISVDWSATKVRAIVTNDDVTKSDTDVHAWSELDFVNYLAAWAKEAQNTTERFGWSK